MISLLVGHRGTGKTQLIERMRFYWRDAAVDFIDLDDQIEKKIGKTIRDLFFEHGESYFRELERQLFLEILQSATRRTVIVAGAGFDLSVVPETVHVLWLRRKTDDDGRIFLNRPRLEPDMHPLEEFKARALVREQRYRTLSHQEYLMPEGVFENKHFAQTTEKNILSAQYKDVGGCLTILPEVFKSDFAWQLFKSRWHQKGIEHFELRDDLLSLEQMRKAVGDFTGEKFIYSFRKKPDGELLIAEEALVIAEKAALVDWPLEWGRLEIIQGLIPREKLVLSLHSTLTSLSEDLKHLSFLEDEVGHVKYAPEVSTYSELLQLHHWQEKKPNARSVLPRSPRGRWAWYRLLQKGQQLINFIKEGEGSAYDQPSLFEWLTTPAKAKRFAAVLGDPVYHSFTPLEHSDFFHKRNIPVWAVQITREEWSSAIQVLKELGLSFAAVTAPHKENAAQLCGSKDPVNTLYWDKTQWRGASTDEAGFLELTEGIGMIAPLQKEVAVWGGQGTLPMMKHSIPHASFYSSRTGKMRDGITHEEVPPKVLIWAAPRGSGTILPPKEWEPSLVLDLNYKEDSMGREYAQLCGANYTSGLVMFLAQAREQRVFWAQFTEEEPS
jgi:Shikimate 5-dehydrogenase